MRDETLTPEEEWARAEALMSRMAKWVPDYADRLASDFGRVTMRLLLQCLAKDPAWRDDEIIDHIRRQRSGPGMVPHTLRDDRAVAAWLAAYRRNVTDEVGRGDEAGEPSYGTTGLTRSAILAARSAWQTEGRTSPAIHRRLGVSRATLLRGRHRFGLVPWPD